MNRRSLLLPLSASLFTILFLGACKPTTEWVARYDGPDSYVDRPTAMTVDAAGYVYVTGRSHGSGTDQDYATVKYDPEGSQVWAARYNGPGNDLDAATAVAVDDRGNIYVTGNSDGGDSSLDYATVKYDSSGNELWVARHIGNGNGWDEASGLVVDGDGRVTVTGRSAGARGDHDYVTIQYGPDGDLLWLARYDGPGNDWDGARAMATDALGNIYVTGDSAGIGTSQDYATVKYDPEGREVWTARYDGPGDRYNGDYANALAVDDRGFVHVTGDSEGDGTEDDFATIKYGPDGETIWVARYDSPYHWDDEARFIALDGAGNVHVAGMSEGDYRVVQYGPAGDLHWTARHEGPADDMDIVAGLALDGEGNVLVTGFVTVFESMSGIPFFDMDTLKLDPEGRRLWVARYSGPTRWDDAGQAIAVDGEGSVYVTGYSTGVDTGPDYVTIKYSRDGALPSPSR